MAESTSFESAVEQIESAFSRGSVYAPWVSFEMGSLKISTSDKNRNYFMSLRNSRNGSGQANEFTLNIAYVPSSDMNTNTQADDVDRIDKELSVQDKICYIQYGYTYPIELKSPKYEGRVMKYTVEIREGTLFYTITGYSGITRFSETNPTFPQYKNKKPTEIVEDIFNEYLSKDGYSIEFVNNCKGTDKKVENIDIVNDINIFEYMSSILKQAEYENDTEETPLSERSTYQYYIDDIKDSKKILVERIDPKELNKEAPKVVFNWMSREKGNLVVDFQTSFDGSVVMAQNFDTNDDSLKKYGLNEKGEQVESYNIYIAPTSGSESDQDEAQALTTWAKATQYSYSANLTLLGIPAHIKLSERLKIIPLIYGKAHHTQGVYMITKIEDQIDSGGFITTLELIKITPEDNSDSKK